MKVSSRIRAVVSEFVVQPARLPWQAGRLRHDKPAN